VPLLGKFVLFTMILDTFRSVTSLFNTYIQVCENPGQYSEVHS
jgi:hypothetical protein